MASVVNSESQQVTVMSEESDSTQHARKKRKLQKEPDESDLLADIVKGVHKKLKKNYLKSGKNYDKIWSEHTKDEGTLKSYAEAMHKLASEHWESGSGNRIEWIHSQCQEYFYNGGMKKWLNKDARRREHFKETEPSIHPEQKSDPNGILKLLDVGSCYNPLAVYTQYNITAIDLQPANDAVKQCDFLSVEIGTETLVCDNSVTTLSSDFDIVTFCLLLEYLPSPDQRWTCILKAWELLKYYGLLLIMTPDSHKQHLGAPRMKRWKEAIETAGFHRVKYEKLEHLHGLAFRKIARKEEPSSEVAEKLCVPQDFNTEISEDESIEENESKTVGEAGKAHTCHVEPVGDAPE